MNAYDALVARFASLSRLEGAAAMLQWDAATYMPAGAADIRADQLATLAEYAHAAMADPALAELLAAAESANASHPLERWQRANLACMRHRATHATALPASLVAALTRARMHSEHAWREVKQQGSADAYRAYLPLFREVIQLSREAAQAKACVLGTHPYDALLDSYDPGLRMAAIDPLFADLSSWLPDYADALIAEQSAHAIADIPIPEVPIAAQEQVGRALMQALGFDFNRGRIDTSSHPFCGGVPGDVRLTTRYRSDAFTDALYGVLHETGHALYEMGLPEAWRGQPVGEARGMSAHESQSLIIEMQLGLSRPFLRYLSPLLLQHFGAHPAWEEDALQHHLTRVRKSFIRVTADEVTYPLHILLRYELEKALIDGTLDAADIPEAWNSRFARDFGITPTHLGEGCMQDIHWPEGMFGYFPTYTLGALFAAQLFAAFTQSHPAWQDAIAAGEFSLLTRWLTQAVHQHASHMEMADLVVSATGAPLGTGAFRAHLQARYGDAKAGA